MRFLKGWCGAKGWCDNSSGSRPNSFGRQHLAFDKGGKFSAERGTIAFLQWLWGWRGSMQLRQSLRLDGKKVCNIKRADISQAGRNKATVCVVPSSHLPLTREASLVQSKVLLSFCNGCGDGGGRCNGRGKPLALRKVGGIVRFWEG